MANPGLGGTISSATDVNLNVLSDGDMFVRKNGLWSNTKTDVVDESAIATSNTPTSGQVLGWDGSSLAWTTPAASGGSASMNIYVANPDMTWPTGMIEGTEARPTLLFANISSNPDMLGYPAPPISSSFTYYYGPTPVSVMPTVTASITDTQGRRVTFGATPTPTPGSSVMSYAWTFSDGATSTSATPTHTFPDTGAISATVQTTDTNGMQATDTVNGNVVEGLPAVTLTLAADSDTIIWTATASDPENEPLSYAWSGTDSLTGSTASVTKTYSTAGSKSATVTVTDSKGNTASASASHTIILSDANGVFTSDDFSGTAADGAALLTRSTVPNAGGSPMTPSGVSVTNSNIALEAGVLRLTGSTEVEYTIGSSHPRLAATFTSFTATATPRLRFKNSPAQQISTYIRGGGDIVTEWGAVIVNAAPAGTFQAGDRLDADLNCAAGVLTVKHIRAGTVQNTYTHTGTAMASYSTGSVAHGAAGQTARIDDLIVAEVKP